MPTHEQFLENLNKIIKDLNKQQAELLAKRLSAAFVAGFRPGQQQGTAQPAMTDLQRRAIRNLAAENLGYIAEYNYALGKQLEGRTKELIAEGKGYADIRHEMKPYIEKTFGTDGTVTIDRRGQTRTVIQVGKDGSLTRVEKEITQPYTTNTEAYADMLSRTATHAAYEKGRAEGYQSQGYQKWRFVGPADERARAWHVALIGSVFEYGTSEGDMALEVLSEPNCRHRAVPFFDNPKWDTPDSFFEQQKQKAGLKFEDGEWGFVEKSPSPD